MDTTYIHVLYVFISMTAPRQFDMNLVMLDRVQVPVKKDCSVGDVTLRSQMGW